MKKYIPGSIVYFVLLLDILYINWSLRLLHSYILYEYILATTNVAMKESIVNKKEKLDRISSFENLSSTFLPNSSKFSAPLDI